MLFTAVQRLDYIFLGYFLVVNLFYALLLLVSIPIIVKRSRELKLEDFQRLIRSESLPGIGIIIPVFNEEKTIVETVQSILKLDYPLKKIIIVNDSSIDETLKRLNEAFDLVEMPAVYPQKIKTAFVNRVFQSLQTPELLIIDKQHGGKGDTLNAGINACPYPLFLSCDADTLIERDALLRMVRPFLVEKGVIAQGGTIRLLNGCEQKDGVVTRVRIPLKLIEGVQVIEYLRAFLYGRLGWNSLGGNFIISGAFGLFDRQAVVECGGYLSGTVAEDIEITVALTRKMREKKKQKATLFLPDPVAWTHAPNTWKQLARQRERWHRALILTMSRHRDMFLNPKYGPSGLIGMPYFALGEMVQPIIEILTYIFIGLGLFVGALDWEFVFLFFSLTWGMSVLFTIASITMESMTFQRIQYKRHLFSMFLFSILENFGYRQLYQFWKLKAFYKYFYKSRRWG